MLQRRRGLRVVVERPESDGVGAPFVRLDRRVVEAPPVLGRVDYPSSRATPFARHPRLGPSCRFCPPVASRRVVPSLQRSHARSTSTALRRAPYTGPEVKDADTIERMRVAGRLAAQAHARGGPTHRAGCHDRRARPHRPRVPLRPRRLPLDPGLQGLPEVPVHLDQRGHLSRHPRQHRAAATATSSTSTSRPSSAASTATPTPPTWSERSTRSRGCWSSAPRQAMMRAHQGRRPGAPGERHRTRHRGVRPALRLRRRP